MAACRSICRPESKKHGDCRVEFVDHRIYQNDENLKIGYNGFARMRLQVDQLSVEYVDHHGTVICSEGWTTDGGALARIYFSKGEHPALPQTGNPSEIVGS